MFIISFYTQIQYTPFSQVTWIPVCNIKTNEHFIIAENLKVIRSTNLCKELSFTNQLSLSIMPTLTFLKSTYVFFSYIVCIHGYK